ncbi:MAG TPA: SCO family protein [Chthoniobacterales bacterium]
MRSGPKVIGGIFGFAALAVGVLLFWRPFAGTKPQELPDLGPMPRFHLVDQEERPMDNGALVGHLTVVQVVCSRCAAASPVLLSRFAEIDQNFRRSDRLRLISLTAEPAADPPAVLAAIGVRYEATDHWSFLTGEESELTRVAVALLGSNQPAASSALTQAAVGAQVGLVDGRGRLRRVYNGLDDDFVASVLSDAGTLLRSPEKRSK